MAADSAAERLVALLHRHNVDLAAAKIDVCGRDGLWGDDLTDFLNAFCAAFGVNPGDIQWHFHSPGEEGWSLGAIFFPPPYKRMPHIPVNFDTLLAAAETGRWPVQYPEHELPRHRWDLLIDQAVTLLLIVSVIGVAAYKWLPSLVGAR